MARNRKIKAVVSLQNATKNIESRHIGSAAAMVLSLG
jgi:hypothetical protein